MIGQDGQQVLIKHGGCYIRVHPCRLLLEQAAFGQPMVDNQDKDELIKVQQSQTETNVERDEDEKVASDDPVNEQGSFHVKSSNIFSICNLTPSKLANFWNTALYPSE